MKRTWNKIVWTSMLIAAFAISTAVLSGCDKDTGGSDAGKGQTLNSPASGNQGNEVANPVMAKRSENALQATVKEVDGHEVVTNPEAITVIVNKQRSLPEGYEPGDLVEPNVPFSFDGANEKRHMRKEAAEALERLFAGAKEDGMEMRAVSGYRSYARQKVIYANNVRTKGEEYASRVSAVPGTSEHQTGLTIDVSSPSVNNAIEEVFGTSAEGKWLAQHAADYGFVIRYPEGKEGTTGYVYEPWHIRYIGTDLAPDIAKSGLTLEDYFNEDNIKL
ncbi:M15 family metallopeptidase [Paenibacillus pini]|uniref:D-alanyl-D-alanine carboxypeptidase n=1 Tax=Paenibacillus pini JCM 16418 TaxID=1236976 RepID=W7YXU6_9BACL|nr:M15 family metallopeptidase [Paenibacillus pini]GAF09501.1 D-alanyl-D-alanine carboxypeptidase [Paenibacillus pini JCM 16418]